MRKLHYQFLAFQILLLFCFEAESRCKNGCHLAFASYYVRVGSDLTNISKLFDQQITQILPFNPDVPSQDRILEGSRINVPFSCDCLDRGYLGHTFTYVTRRGDAYAVVASDVFANLTTVESLLSFNSYDPNRIPELVPINVTVNCSCGDARVSKDYGLFITYPLRPGENVSTVASVSGVKAELLQQYNPTVDFSGGSGMVFVPGKDENGTFPPLKLSTKGIPGKAIIGISVAGVVGALVLMLCLYVGVYRRKRGVESLPAASEEQYIQLVNGSRNTLEKRSESAALIAHASPGIRSITVDKSVEFLYEELAKATNDFSMANKIGQGGYGVVYYAELRGEKAAIKKMDMQASKQFLAELEVLTHVHHLNLVRLIGYCVEGSLFLVYEFIENGNLSEHLRGSSGRNPLPWSTRVQIALDSARGLEYIHEHTVPVYIHRDIKSANILIDKSFRGKVADFGLAKLTEFGDGAMQTHPVGTFGYMPPEYAQYGEVSSKIDVFAFGVVLYELISAKEAILRTSEFVTEQKGLVALFEEVLSQPDPNKDLCKLIDPKLGDSYPLDSVCKIANLARACTQEKPQLRPTMRTIVVALMTLSSMTEEWDLGPICEDKSLVNLMSGR